MNDGCSSLLSKLTSTDLRRRRAAIRKLEHRSRFPCMERALQDPDTPIELRLLLCEILYRTRWPEAVPILLEQLRSPESEVRANAADALGAIRDVSAGPSLVALLDDLAEPRIVRDTAAFSIGLVGYHPGTPSLITALNDAEETVRLCAAKSLMFLRAREAIPALEEARSHEVVPRVREQIAEALQRIQNPDREQQ